MQLGELVFERQFTDTIKGSNYSLKNRFLTTQPITLIKNAFFFLLEGLNVYFLTYFNLFEKTRYLFVYFCISHIFVILICCPRMGHSVDRRDTWIGRYRVFRKNSFFFTIHCNPSLAFIAVRDLQSSQRNASVQSLLLAANFLYNQ